MVAVAATTQSRNRAASHRPAGFMQPLAGRLAKAGLI